MSTEEIVENALREWFDQAYPDRTSHVIEWMRANREVCGAIIMGFKVGRSFQIANPDIPDGFAAITQATINPIKLS